MSFTFMLLRFIAEKFIAMISRDNISRTGSINNIAV
jgi:hypothetical protein